VNSEFDLYPEPVLSPDPHQHSVQRFLSTELPVDGSPTILRRATSTSSLRKVDKLNKLLLAFGLRSKRRQVVPGVPPKLSPPPSLPRNLSFCFSAAGNALLLWKRNGKGLVHVDVRSREACYLDLSSTIPFTELDRSVTIRLVAAGRAWASIVVLHKQVRSCSLCDP
jgi:hypothetical protein